jgi:hypothetical protein
VCHVRPLLGRNSREELCYSIPSPSSKKHPRVELQSARRLRPGIQVAARPRDVAVPQRRLHLGHVTSRSMAWLACACRNQCGDTGASRPTRAAARLTRPRMARSRNWTPVLRLLSPDDRQVTNSRPVATVWGAARIPSTPG